jgi:hypothetical protein
MTGQILIAVATFVGLLGLQGMNYWMGRMIAGMKTRMGDVTWHRIAASLALLVSVGVFMTLYLIWESITLSGVMAFFTLVLQVYFQADFFHKGQRDHQQAYSEDLKIRQQRRWADSARRGNTRAQVDLPIHDTKLFWWSMTGVGVLATSLSLWYNVGFFAYSSGIATLLALGWAIVLTWKGREQ